MKLLNFGSLNIDYVYQVNHIVEAGETESSIKRDIHPGGKGLNQSVAIARAGGEVYHAGKIGTDGIMLVDLCKTSKVHTDFIKIADVPTGHTIIQVDRTGQNSIILYGGANRCIDENFVDEVLSHFSQNDIILLQNEISCLSYIVEKAYQKGMRIVLNPSPFDERVNDIDFSKISMFIINEVEGRQITGASYPDKIIETMKRKYPDATAILTVGADGSWYWKGDVQYRQDAVHVNAVDTTAAGDTFTGYFLACAIAGKDVQESLAIASKAAAVAVTREGAIPSIPWMDEIVK